ncbi:MAG: NAD(P)/FAD-dependent oxidoreductase [Alphaproteobacteria bacterium]|nr:NAD(P)/FAD-dependent oxidoreductase [Alphaproteobacteria bacterium]
MEKKSHYDVIIIGAGAAGLMCAATAGARGKSVLIIDHSKKIGEKIRISGGGRANFTNIHTRPEAFLSKNKHFCKSALNQYTQDDFIALVKKHKIDFHEKTLGQLFCDKSAQQIIDMLVKECTDNNVQISMETEVSGIHQKDKEYAVKMNAGEFTSSSLVIATGGLSIPKIGATKFGYDIAKQFNLGIVTTAPALVPLTFQAALLERCKELSGLSVDAVVTYGKNSFREGLLFTHRGLSGPSILQISSYWQEGSEIEINLLPDVHLYDALKEKKNSAPKKDIKTVLSNYLPDRLAQSICDDQNIKDKIAELADKKLQVLANAINHWRIKPSGTEGYRTAEVTLGGVDTNELNSKTMECRKHEGLFFIGEVVDVTGHLGGYNFQWAWSSGYVAGQNV